MGHHRRFFPGRGLGFIFVFFLLLNMFGRSGGSGFLVLLLVFFVLVPLVKAAAQPRAYSGDRRMPLARDWRREAFDRRPVQARPVQPAPARSAATNLRSLADLPGTCKSCGGPVTETTVDWRGSAAHCGFCGSRLDR